MNIAVFLDAVMAINGPLFLIRKSHRADVLNAGHDKLTTSYPLWTLDNEPVTALWIRAPPPTSPTVSTGPNRAGIVAPTGQPGSVLMFHGNLVTRTKLSI
jgi:ectoine hydroxylase